MGPFIPRKRRPGPRRHPDHFVVGDRVRVRQGEHLTFSNHIVDDQLPGDIYSYEGTVCQLNHREGVYRVLEGVTPLINWDNGPYLVYDATCLELVAEEGS
jgi:hypothetical protein